MPTIPHWLRVHAPALLALFLLAAVPATAQPLLLEFSSPNEESSGEFGTSVASVPDTNSDGVADLLVGAPFEDPDASPDEAGRAYLFSGRTGDLLRTLTSPNEQEDGYFGFSVAGVPDINGDGVADLLVGAREEHPGASPTDAGRAYLFSGATGNLLQTLVSPNEEIDGFFGSSVAGVPDADGDGRGDLLIGAPDENSGSSNSGRAYLYSGATGSLIRTLLSPNPGFNGRFGSAVAGVPDTNNDGRGDLFVGAGGSEGKAYLFSGATGSLLHELTSPSGDTTSRFGFAVAGVPDTDGDSVTDLLVGAEDENISGGPFSAGKAYLFSGATGALLHELQSSNPDGNGAFGSSVTGVPDANGDGRGDLLVGAPGSSERKAYLFSGATGTLLHELESPNPEFNSGFGSAVAGMPDADGDGRGDLLVGAPDEDPSPSPTSAGRAYLFSGAAGTAFDLTATALTPLTVPRGGSIQFQFTASNGTGNPASGDLFFVAKRLGNIVASGRILSGTLQPGQSVTSTFTQPIPNSAPTGNYTYDLSIGQFPSVMADTETFIVEVTNAARSGDGSNAWAVMAPPSWEEAAAPEAAATALPSVVSLAAAYPNPFARQTTLAFSLPKAERVRLAIYDVLGREVALLTDGAVEAGRHEAVFDASELPSGVYLVRLETGATVQTQRLTLLR